MPYEIARDPVRCPASKPFAVRQRDDPNNVKGCHVSRSDAEAQMRALAANMSTDEHLMAEQQRRRES